MESPKNTPDSHDLRCKNVFLAVAREVYSLWPCDPHHFLRSAGNLSLVLHLVEKNHDSVWLVVLTCFNHLEKCESQWEG